MLKETPNNYVMYRLYHNIYLVWGMTCFSRFSCVFAQENGLSSETIPLSLDLGNENPWAVDLAQVVQEDLLSLRFREQILHLRTKDAQDSFLCMVV